MARECLVAASGQHDSLCGVRRRAPRRRALWSPATACPSVMGGSARSYYVERPVDGSPESG